MNIDFINLVNKYGSPLYVYDADKVKSQYTHIFDTIPYKKLKVHYAMKANYNAGILKTLLNLGAGIDAVSPAEILFAIKCGFTKEKIIFTANNLSEKDLKTAGELGVLFNIGSTSELKRYGALYPNTDICLRFNPDVVAGAHKKIQTGGNLTKFGILFDDLEEVKDIVKSANLNVIGIHKHTGSGIKDTEKYIEAVNNLLQICTPENFPNLEFVDFGGGLYVPYHPDDKKIDYSEFGKIIIEKIQAMNSLYNKEISLYFEPGKYIVAESGNMIVQANTIKNNRGRFIIGTDSGFNHLMRPMIYDAYHHIKNLSNPNGEIRKYDIAGNICETGDVFATDRDLPEIREGDFLLIENAGAYCYSMGSVYNLRAMPAEILVENGKDVLIRKQLNDEELTNQILSECNL